MRKCIFLDRDGIINRERGEYTFRPEDFEILPGIRESLQRLKSQGWIFVVITNQGGIAKGLYSLEDLLNLNSIMKEKFNEVEVEFEEIYYCPHHPDKTKCLCRKPDSLLFEKALARFDIDPAESFMIGDKQRDFDSAEKAGIKCILIEPNSPLLFKLDQLIETGNESVR